MAGCSKPSKDGGLYSPEGFCIRPHPATRRSSTSHAGFWVQKNRRDLSGAGSALLGFSAPLPILRAHFWRGCQRLFFCWHRFSWWNLGSGKFFLDGPVGNLRVSEGSTPGCRPTCPVSGYFSSSRTTSKSHCSSPWTTRMMSSRIIGVLLFPMRPCVGKPHCQPQYSAAAG